MSTVNHHERCADLDKGDSLMYFDSEYNLWFKHQIAKATENHFILCAVAWDRNDLKPIVRRSSDQLESESDTSVQWEASADVVTGYIRVHPPHIPPSVQNARELEEEHRNTCTEQ